MSAEAPECITVTPSPEMRAAVLRAAGLPDLTKCACPHSRRAPHESWCPAVAHLPAGKYTDGGECDS